ncbi:MAG TPA: 3-deoxy-7-phosphoheptulonate synthase [Fimbriimonadaceae bacterium]|nr:3-deoxy-7-phosphoheptulonate synthase [Fimbriimonadaceae bacterium]
MIIVMRSQVESQKVDSVVHRLEELGYEANVIWGVEKVVIGAVGVAEQDKYGTADQLRSFDGVDKVHLISKPYKFVAREGKPTRTTIHLDGVTIGSDEVVIMAGPCTVESEAQVMMTAQAVAEAGATVLRGGAYKPSTSPYSYQGMGVQGLEILREAGRRYNLRVITEVMDVRKVDLVAQYADVLQIGTRNMQNYDLLKEVGQSKVPVMLKRGMSARLEEWLLAAEYIAAAGNERIMLCERGIRTFDSHTRNTLDLAAVPSVKNLTHLPVIVDPSQGTGRRDLVDAMSKAAVACGADGLLIEVHPSPDHALKDGAQSMTVEGFRDLVPGLARVAEAIGRKLVRPQVRQN